MYIVYVQFFFPMRHTVPKPTAKSWVNIKLCYLTSNTSIAYQCIITWMTGLTAFTRAEIQVTEHMNVKKMWLFFSVTFSPCFNLRSLIICSAEAINTARSTMSHRGLQHHQNVKLLNGLHMEKRTIQGPVILNTAQSRSTV